MERPVSPSQFSQRSSGFHFFKKHDIESLSEQSRDTVGPEQFMRETLGEKRFDNGQ